jgi:hypothetical protein
LRDLEDGGGASDSASGRTLAFEALSSRTSRLRGGRRVAFSGRTLAGAFVAVARRRAFFAAAARAASTIRIGRRAAVLFGGGARRASFFFKRSRLLGGAPLRRAPADFTIRRRAAFFFGDGAARRTAFFGAIRRPLRGAAAPRFAGFFFGGGAARRDALFFFAEGAARRAAFFFGGEAARCAVFFFLMGEAARRVTRLRAASLLRFGGLALVPAFAFFVRLGGLALRRAAGAGRFFAAAPPRFACRGFLAFFAFRGFAFALPFDVCRESAFAAFFELFLIVFFFDAIRVVPGRFVHAASLACAAGRQCGGA